MAAAAAAAAAHIFIASQQKTQLGMLGDFCAVSCVQFISAIYVNRPRRRSICMAKWVQT